MIPRDILSAHMYDVAFIAGGYAACPALASDIDVWVRRDESGFQVARAAILQHLGNEFFNFDEQQNEVVEQGELAPGYSVNIQKVAIVHNAANLPVHIMLTNCTAEQLIEGFDISTHQVALTSQGVVKGSGFTPVFIEPRVLQNTTTTPERMRKIAARYSFKLAPEGAL